MTKLEKLYSIIENSRDLGVWLNKDVLQQSKWRNWRKVSSSHQGFKQESELLKIHQNALRFHLHYGCSNGRVYKLSFG